MKTWALIYINKKPNTIDGRDPCLDFIKLNLKIMVHTLRR